MGSKCAAAPLGRGVDGARGCPLQCPWHPEQGLMPSCPDAWVLIPVYLSGWCMQSPGPGPGKARMSRCQRGDLHMCSSPSPSSAELSSPPLSTTEPRMEPGSHAAPGNSRLCPGEGGGPKADGAARPELPPPTSEHQNIQHLRCGRQWELTFLWFF